MVSKRQMQFYGYALLILSMSVFIGCKNDINKINNLDLNKDSPAEVDKDVTLYYSSNAHINIKLIAPLLKRYNGKEPYIIFPKGIAVYFYDSTNTISSQLTADYAINRVYKNQMEAKSNVIVKNEKGEKLNTEHLIWDEKKDLIYSNKFVKITKKNEILMGNGFESNSDFSEYKINDLEGVIQLDDDSAKTNQNDSTHKN